MARTPQNSGSLCEQNTASQFNAFFNKTKFSSGVTYVIMVRQFEIWGRSAQSHLYFSQR